jgi:hypothetical protein
LNILSLIGIGKFGAIGISFTLPVEIKGNRGYLPISCRLMVKDLSPESGEGVYDIFYRSI